MYKLDSEQIIGLLKASTTYKNGYVNCRYGQALYNSLHILHTNVALKINGTWYDPYYEDKKIFPCLRRISLDEIPDELLQGIVDVYLSGEGMFTEDDKNVVEEIINENDKSVMCEDKKYVVKEFISYGKDGDCEYKILIREGKKATKYELYASESSCWSEHIRGTLLMKISDNGDGIKLDKKYKKLGYDEADYLRVLLSVNNNEASRPSVITLMEVDSKKVYKY